jgi:hypothetical protein
MSAPSPANALKGTLRTLNVPKGTLRALRRCQCEKAA